MNKHIAMAKKHLPCFFISSDKNSFESLLSKMAVNWICMLRKKYMSENGMKIIDSKELSI